HVRVARLHDPPLRPCLRRRGPALPSVEMTIGRGPASAVVVDTEASESLVNLAEPTVEPLDRGRHHARMRVLTLLELGHACREGVELRSADVAHERTHQTLAPTIRPMTIVTAMAMAPPISTRNAPR